MTTITREQALKIIEAADEVISALAGTNEDVHPGSDNMLRLWDDLNDRYAPPEVVRELARIALASLEAEPVGAFHIAEQQVDGTSDYLKDGEWPIDNGIIEVYAAPPVPVVPAALPENDDEDGHDIDYLEPSEVYALGRTAGWNACRAAMLQGSQPVSQTYKLNELSGNSPVTPDAWISCSERMPDKLIPVMVMYEDGEMWSAMWNGNRWDDGTEYPDPHSVTHWREMPAAPQQEVNRG
ncbi:Eaa protein [Escherichia coli]|nr:Eaa protein [Escherichia coli]